MSDPTNTDAATANTDAATANTDGQTANTDGQTTSGPAGGDDSAGGFEYPDGSTPPVGDDGLPILEDRSADFPDEAAEATELVGEPVIVTRDGRQHFLGLGSGMSGYRGLAAKRAEKRAESDDDETPADEGYDPSAHTVTEVTAYLDENPDQATYVLDRERTGKARVTLIGA